MKNFIQNLSPRGIRSDSSQSETDIIPPKVSKDKPNEKEKLSKSPRGLSLMNALKGELTIGMEIIITNEEELNLLKNFRFGKSLSFQPLSNPISTSRISSRDSSKKKDPIEKIIEMKARVEQLEHEVELLNGEKSRIKKKESEMIVRMEYHEKLVSSLSSELVAKNQEVIKLEREKKQLFDQNQVVEDETRDLKAKITLLESKMTEISLEKDRALDDLKRNLDNQQHSLQGTFEFEKNELKNTLKAQIDQLVLENASLNQEVKMCHQEVSLLNLKLENEKTSHLDTDKVITLLHEIEVLKSKNQELMEIHHKEEDRLNKLNQELSHKVTGLENQIKSSATLQLQEDIQKRENLLDEKVVLIEKNMADSTQQMLNVIKLFGESQNEFKIEKEKFKELKALQENNKQNEMIQQLTKDNLALKKDVDDLKATIVLLEKAKSVRMTHVQDKYVTVLEQIKENAPRCHTVDLTKSRISDENVVELCKALERNTNVTKLILNDNPIKGACMDVVCDLIAKTKHLDELHFEGCEIENPRVKQLIASLEKNHTLIQCTAGKLETDEDIEKIESLMDRNFTMIETQSKQVAK